MTYFRTCLGALCAAIGVAFQTPASAADYYLIASNANQITVLDADSIASDVHGARATLVAIRRAAQTAGLSFAYAVADSDYDCASRRFAAKSIQLYDESGAPSSQQIAPDKTRGAWQPVTPNTQGDNAWKFVCAGPDARTSIGFHLTGLTLDKIVASIFDGTWPYDEVLPRLQSAPPTH
jgi:hypothetical protein